MPDKSERCSGCGRYTTRGQEQEAVRYRAKPLSGIDLSQPLSVLIEQLRSDIGAVRGKLQDIGWGYTGWKEHLDPVHGLLTCGLVSLHHTMLEMREHERRYPRADKPEPPIKDADASAP